jgi:hypothetical protein
MGLLCEAEHPARVFCTRLVGHDGPHIATMGPFEVGAWELVRWTDGADGTPAWLQHVDAQTSELAVRVAKAATLAAQRGDQIGLLRADLSREREARATAAALASERLQQILALTQELAQEHAAREQAEASRDFFRELLVRLEAMHAERGDDPERGDLRRRLDALRDETDAQ